MSIQGRSIVVATPSTSKADGGDRVVRLIRSFRTHGCQVEVLALAHGSDSAAFERLAPVTFVQQLPSPTIALTSRAVGARARQSIRGWGLRRWLDSRPDAGIVVSHPAAVSVLRYDRPDRRVVAMLPSPSLRLAEVAPVDLASLKSAQGWLVCDDRQARAVARCFDRPCLVPGQMLIPSEVPVVEEPDQGVIVLLPDPGSWNHVDHAAELASQLGHRGLDVRWVTHGPEDRWLARHDLDHIGAPPTVRLVEADCCDVLVGASSVVRTGYQEIDSPIVVAARRAGLPVIGFGADVTPGQVRPGLFDVEAVATQAEHLRSAAMEGRFELRPEPGYGTLSGDLMEQVLRWLSVEPPHRTVQR